MEYKDSEDAEVSFKTLEVDNEGFVESASEILIEKILEDTKENKE